MIFYGLDKFGVYEGWSPLFDYVTIGGLNVSERLPFPTGKKVIVNKKTVATEGAINLDGYVNRPKDSKLKINDYVKLLKNVDKLEYVDADEKAIKKLIDILNSHTTFQPSEGAVKNFVTYNMHEVIMHPTNQMSATTSVDTGGLGWRMEVDKKDASVLWNTNNPLHLYKLKEINAVGKATVGVMANGVKAFFGLTHAFNKAYQNEVNVTDNSYFYHEILGKHVVRLADTVTTAEQVQILNESVRKITGMQEDIAFLVNGDVSISLSALVSLAVDNAKELALAKLNAGIEFAGMHIYMTMLGFSPKEIADFMTSPEVDSFIQSQKNNFFISHAGFLPNEVYKSNNDTFKKIYFGAQELRSLNSYLGLNQGIKPQIEKLTDLLFNLKQVLHSREHQVFSKDMFNQWQSTDKTSFWNAFETKLKQEKPYLFENGVSLINLKKFESVIFQPLDLDKFINNSDYNTLITDYYNVIKHTFNIFDVVNNLPHIKGILKAIITTKDSLTFSSARAEFILNTVPNTLVRLANEGNNQNIIKHIQNNTSLPAIYKSAEANKMKKLFTDYVITSWFASEKFDKYTFKLSEINPAATKIYSSNDRAIQTGPTEVADVFNLKTTEGLATFKYMMETYIIPELKNKMLQNAFLKKLQKTKLFNLDFFKLDIDMMLINETVTADVFVELLAAFDDLSDMESDLTDSFGNKMKYGDLFFIYNAIVHKNSLGSVRLTSIFKNYANDENSLDVSLSEHYAKFDNGTLKVNISEGDILFNLYAKNDEVQITIEDSIKEENTAVEDGEVIETEKNIEEKVEVNKTKKSLSNKNPNFTFTSEISLKTEDITKKLEAVEKLKMYFINNEYLLEFKCK